MNVNSSRLLIKEVSSRFEKERMLKVMLLEYPFMSDVLYWMYNPYITYGISAINVETTSKVDFNKTSWEETIKPVLIRLHERTFTGNKAELMLTSLYESINLDAGDMLTCVLNHSLDCGLGMKTVVKHLPNIPTFDVQLAQLYSSRHLNFPCVVEPKLDGVRCITLYETNGKITMLSRTGKVFSMPYMEQALKDALKPGFMYDGEILHPLGFKRTIQTVTTESNTGEDVVYNIFHCMPISEMLNGKSTGNWMRYNVMLNENIKESPNAVRIVSNIVNNHDEISYLYEGYVKNGYEGVMIKDMTKPYQFGRNYAWMKLKPINDIEGTVIDMTEGNGKYQGMLGYITVAFNGVPTDVGTGFTDDERKIFWQNPSFIMNKRVTCLFQEFTPDGKLRFPRFKNIRERGF